MSLVRTTRRNMIITSDDAEANGKIRSILDILTGLLFDTTRLL